MAENWRLPERIVEGHTGSVVDEDELLRTLAPARVVYVAERHDRPPDHAIQLFVLVGMYRQSRDVALGVEMLPRSLQGAVDAYVAGEVDEAGFLDRVSWQETWGFDFGLYRPLFEFARAHEVPIIALNARREITRAVAEGGLENLDEDLAADLPELDLDHRAHRAYVREAFGVTDTDGEDAHPGFDFENFYAAQVVWDETMADTVARALEATDGPQRMLVIAGSGHVEYRFGIPERAARRGAEPFRTILPVVYDDLEEDVHELVDGSVADYIWLMSPGDDLPDDLGRPKTPRARAP